MKISTTSQKTKQQKLGELYALIGMDRVDQVIRSADATLRALGAKKREC